MDISGNIEEVPLDDIQISDKNVRLTDSEVKIEDLAKNIEKIGLIQPVILKGIFGEPPYELVVGQRRYKAHILLKNQGKLRNESIKAIFINEDISDVELMILSLAENIQRVKINYVDQAEAITSLYIHFNRNVGHVARELGVSESTVRDYVKLDKIATDKAKRLLRERKINKIDVRRAMDAAQGDKRKANRILDELVTLPYYAKQNIVEISKENPNASVKEIVEASKEPRIEKTIILRLSVDVEKGLRKAQKALSIDTEAIVEKALEKWLDDNNFLYRNGESN